VSYWLHPAAEADLTEAAVFYSQHASKHIAEVVSLLGRVSRK
jgi:hypothetical protein